MKAAFWTGPEMFQIQEVPLPATRSGSVLVKVKACAICGSDLRIFKHGNPRVVAPRILGHEISGEVVDIGAGVKHLKPGQRISIGADIPCQQCTFCNEGMPNCCDTNLALGYQFDGGYSDYVLLDPLIVSGGPIATFGPSLSFEEAALSEPLACCLNGFERTMMQPGKSVAIFGAGPIGILLAKLAKFLGASQILVLDTNPMRLSHIDTFGLGEMINTSTEPGTQAVLERTHGKGADVIFTACPSLSAQSDAVMAVAKRGIVNFFGGLPAKCEHLALSSNHLHYREAYITGSHGSTPAQHRKALELIESHQISVKELITDRFCLEALPQAFSKASSGQGLKVIVRPNE